MTAATLSGRLGAWAAGLDLAAVPAPVQAEAKRCLIDLFGVALAGSRTAVARRARALASAEHASGPAALWATDDGGAAAPPEGLAATGAAFANAVAAHALDFDDTCYAGIVHGSAVVGPAAAAAAARAGAGGAGFLAAFIAGVEVEYALGAALTDALYYRGWFNTAVLGTLGAAAAAARALGLDAEAAGRAIGLAALQAAGLKAAFGTDAKPYLAGRAAAAGLHAALFAAAGASAPAPAFEEGRGFLAVLNGGTLLAEPVAALGRRWSLLDPGVAFKLYPVCSAAQAAAEALGALIAEEGLDPAAVLSVRCAVSRLVAVSLTFDRPRSVAEAQFSMPFALGCILAFGDLGIARLDAAMLADEGLRAAMARVEMREWDRAGADPDIERRCPEGAELEVAMADGRRFRRFACAATGMPGNPMPEAALEAKFLANAGPVLGQAGAARLLARLRAIETLPDLAALFGAWAGRGAGGAVSRGSARRRRAGCSI